MADTSLHVALTGDQVNYLARTSFVMQLLTNSNLTGISLSRSLLSSLRHNSSATYLDTNLTVPFIVGFSSNNTSMSPKNAEEILNMFEYLPHKGSPWFAALWISFCVISFVMINLRFYTRAVLGDGLKVDDGFLAASWGLAAGYSLQDAATLYNHHSDRHSWDTTGYDIRMHSRSDSISLLLFFLSSACYKTSLISFYKSLCPSRTYRYTAYILLLIVWCYTILGEVWTVLQCSPFKTWETPLIVKCLPYQKGRALSTVILVVDMLTDIAILCLPLTVICKLQLRVREKWQVCSLICLGCAVCICVGVRINIVSGSGYLNNHDQMRNSLNMCTLTLLEVHLGIMCASAPMLRRCFIQFFPYLKSTVSHISRRGSKRTAATGVTDTYGVRELKTKKARKIRTFPIFPTSLRGDNTTIANTTNTTTVGSSEIVGGETGTSSIVATSTRDDGEGYQGSVDEKGGGIKEEIRTSFRPVDEEKGLEDVEMNIGRRIVDIPADGEDVEPIRLVYSSEENRVIRTDGGHSRSNSRTEA